MIYSCMNPQHLDTVGASQGCHDIPSSTEACSNLQEDDKTILSGEWCHERPVALAVFLCGSNHAINHPPVITIFTWYKLTIPGHGWFMALFDPH